MEVFDLLIKRGGRVMEVFDLLIKKVIEELKGEED